jgi:hypothetical protein
VRLDLAFWCRALVHRCIQQIHNKAGMDATEVMGLEGWGHGSESMCGCRCGGDSAPRQDGVQVNPGHDFGGHAKANGRGGPAPARHRSSIRKRESATRGTWRFRVEGTVWRLRRPHFRPGGYCSLDFENPGARCRVPRYVGGSRSSDKSLTARLSRTLLDGRKQTHWWRKQASNCRSFRARTRRWSRSAAMAASSF